MVRSFREHIRFSAGILLFVLAIVVMPKELWHHCDHTHNSHHETSAGDVQLKAADDCPICDFQIFPHTFSSVQPDMQLCESAFRKYERKQSALLQKHISVFLGRAPPCPAFI